MSELTLETDGAPLLPSLVAGHLQHWFDLAEPYFALRRPEVRVVGDTALAAAEEDLLRQAPW